MTIESETKFVWKILFNILKLPYTLFMVLFGKWPKKELLTPLHDIWYFLKQAKATLILVIINIAVFIYQITLMRPEVFESLVFQPAYILQLKFFPMLASWFLHGSWGHLLGNMLFLLIFGRVIEQKFGSIRMLMIYFGSGIISDIFAAIFLQGGIGASGAISGLIAAAILIAPFYFTYIFIIPLPIMVIGWIGIITDITGIFGPPDNIGHFAHLGGYIAISLLLFLLSKEEKKKMRFGFWVNIVFFVVAALFYYFVLSKSLVLP